MMASTPEYLHPRDEILACMQRIYQYRMTTTSGGNLSLRDENGDIWITPAATDKGALLRDEVVCVHPDGSVEGSKPPSSELKVHQKIYRARPDVRGIVHAHPVACVAFSIAGTAPDTRVLRQAYQICNLPVFAPFALPGSAALGDAVAEACRGGRNAIVMENHGIVTAGHSLNDAFRCFETLEFAAKTIIRARQLGVVRYLDEQDLAFSPLRDRVLPHFDPDYRSSGERELRALLAEFIRRGYRQRLFISTEGSFSARLDESSFLITPHDFDRAFVNPSDLVLVRNGHAESGKQHSHVGALHEAIYNRNPGVGAIINACPVNATAFSLTDSDLDTRTIPESYVVVRRVARAQYGLQFDSVEAVAAQVSAATPSILLENDGVLVTGKSILEAFDRLEVLESTAEALIDCRVLGELSRMPDRVISELVDAYQVPQ